MDVRLDPIGPVNRFIVWAFTGKKPRLLRRIVSNIFHVELPILQSPLRMTHPYGIVMSSSVKLGKNVTVFQGVTIGSKREGKKAGTPTIEDDVCIFPNAVLIGRIRVGCGATVAPGAVVIDDVPAGATVAGNPAKVIHRVGRQEELTPHR